MRFCSLAVAAVFAALSPAEAQITEIPGSEFETGHWIGGAYTDERGEFSYCYVTVSYVNGQTLWVGLYPNDTLSILLSQPGVTFQPGQTFELWVMMETGLPTIGNGEAWDAAYAGITYNGIRPSVDFLNSGRFLRLLGMGIDDGFDVEGIGPALVQAQDCLARQSGAGGGGRVLESTPSTPKAPPKAPNPVGPKTGSIGSGGALGAPAPKPQP